MSNKAIAQELQELTQQKVDDGKATCCGLLEALSELYPLPFDRPIVFSMEENTLNALGWAIRLLNRTPKGNVSQKLGPVMFISHCPFCGKKFEEKKELNA